MQAAIKCCLLQVLLSWFVEIEYILKTDNKRSD